MKRIVFILIFFMAFFHIKAQNLVTNYSFENYYTCPPNAYFAGYVKDWGGYSPVYFTKFCYNFGLGNSPSNVWGFQYPHTGYAYAGIYTFCLTGKDTTTTGYKVLHNCRDYLQDTLLSPLKAGTRYYVTFYVSLGDSCNYGCNNMGACFSDSALKTSSRKVLWYHTPQVMNDTQHNPLTDTLNWIKVSGNFIAKGGEQFVTIGNFNTDAQNDTIFLGHISVTAPASYYYVDDVIVTTDSNYADSLFPTSVPSIVQPTENVRVYPNPTNTVLTVEFLTQPQQSEHLCLYDVIGQQVESVQLKENTTTIPVSGLPAGIYLYRILNANEAPVQSGKVLVEH